MFNNFLETFKLILLYIFIIYILHKAFIFIQNYINLNIIKNIQTNKDSYTILNNNSNQNYKLDKNNQLDQDIINHNQSVNQINESNINEKNNTHETFNEMKNLMKM